MTIRGQEYGPATQHVFTLVASAAFTTQGISSTLDAGGYGSLTAVVTHSTGTGTQFRVWLQGSLDNGSTWFPLPATNVFKTIAAAAGLNETTSTFTANQASLVNEAGPFTATTIFVGSINNPPPLVRAAWNINGTTPSQTFGIVCLLSQGIAT